MRQTFVTTVNGERRERGVEPSARQTLRAPVNGEHYKLEDGPQ